MIKKTASIILILFASILLLAFAVIPHHHHQQQICFLQSHCENDADRDNKDSDGDSHNHDCEGNIDDCILQEPVVVPSNQWKPEINLVNGINDNSGNDDFQYPLASSLVKAFVHVLYNIATVPLNNWSYSFHVSSSLGLRAPPIV
jgi:hypothetical protein